MEGCLTITAIIPNYNHASYLQARLDSVLNQTRKPDEIILLDDCSTDASRRFIDTYVAQYPEIQFIPNQTNSGSTFVQWNKGVQLAKGDWIWIAESDDIANPHLLANLEKAIVQHQAVVLAYCQSTLIDAQGSVMGNGQAFTDTMEGGELFHRDFVCDGASFIQQFLIHKNTIPNASAVLFNKEAFLQIGGANPTLKSNGDWLVWLQLAALGNIVFVATAYNFFRRHNQSVIGKIYANQQTATYREQYDFTMRTLYRNYLGKKAITKQVKQIRLLNEKYRSYDLGNKGLFLLHQKRHVEAWYDIIKASLFPVFQSGFIKKAVRKQ